MVHPVFNPDCHLPDVRREDKEQQRPRRNPEEDAGIDAEEKMKEEIINHNGRRLKVVEVLEEGKTPEEIAFDRWCDKKYCLKAVKQDGDAIRYVKNKETFLKILKKRQA